MWELTQACTERSWSFFNSPISSLIWSMGKKNRNTFVYMGNNGFSRNNQEISFAFVVFSVSSSQEKTGSCPEAFNKMQQVGTYMGASKNRGNSPKMDGENNGSPY